MLVKILGILLVLLLTSLVVMLSAQETFKDILIPLGLYHPERGVFTDCSLEKNRHIKFCNPNSQQGSRKLSSDNDGNAFELHD